MFLTSCLLGTFPFHVRSEFHLHCFCLILLRSRHGPMVCGVKIRCFFHQRTDVQIPCSLFSSITAQVKAILDTSVILLWWSLPLETLDFLVFESTQGSRTSDNFAGASAGLEEYLDALYIFSFQYILRNSLYFVGESLDAIFAFLLLKE